MNKISGVYKIENTLTGEFYIGSSKNVKKRWREHKSPSRWKANPNSRMYQDMQKYGVDKFDFQILEKVEIEHLKEKEQQFIEILKPTYNDRRVNGLDVERWKEYYKSDRYKEYRKEYRKSDKYKEHRKEYLKEYQQSEKYKETKKKYYNQLCSYKGEVITLGILSTRFQRAGIPHPTVEAKKYLCQVEKQ